MFEWKKFFKKYFIKGKTKEFIKKYDYKLRLFIRFFNKEPKFKKTILFYPDFPYYQHKISRICLDLGCKATNNIKKKHDLAINFQIGKTFKESYEELKQLSQKKLVLNIEINDISKETVDRVFNEVFGYSSFVDPFNFQGRCIRKSIYNARHDAKIIDCPVKDKEKDFIYQRLINNEISSNIYEDIRVVIFKRKISVVFTRHRKEDDRFIDGFQKNIFKTPDELFSIDEINKINSFCHRFGLDYGELDVVRDKNDGIIYILDVNDTPYINTSRIRKTDDTDKIVHLIIENFKKTYIETI